MALNGINCFLYSDIHIKMASNFSYTTAGYRGPCSHLSECILTVDLTFSINEFYTTFNYCNILIKDDGFWGRGHDTCNRKLTSF